MNATKYIKILAAKECLTYKQFAAILNDKTNKNYTEKSFGSKLHRDSLRFTEAYIIADALGYDLEPVKRK